MNNFDNTCDDLPECLVYIDNDSRKIIKNFHSSIINKKKQLSRVRRYMQYIILICDTWITIFSLSIVFVGILTAGFTAYGHDDDNIIYVIYTLDGLIALIGATSAILSRLKKDKNERTEDIYKVLANIAEFIASLDKFIYRYSYQLVSIRNKFSPDNEFVETEEEKQIATKNFIDRKDTDMDALIEQYERIVREYNEQKSKLDQTENQASKKNYEYEKGCFSIFNRYFCCCWVCCKIEFKENNDENNDENKNNNDDDIELRHIILQHNQL